MTNKTVIEHELTAWSPVFADKPTLLVLSKCDLPDALEKAEALREQFPELTLLSSATHLGVRELVFEAWNVISSTPPPSIVQPEPRYIALAPKEPFIITQDGAIYEVTGDRVERLAAMTDFESNEGLGRFERVLAKIGVDKRLRELGAVDGVTVRVAGREFTWSP